MQDTRPRVFVIDDDAVVRNSMRWLLESVDLEVETFGSAEAFLDRFEPGLLGCVVLDVRMPGMGGIPLLERLAGRDPDLPIVVVTGHGDVPMAVRAMKLGALDFIQKPFNDQDLLEVVQEALERNAATRRNAAERAAATRRLETLTGREREVLDHLVEGQSNKTIAIDLGISERTVETHRKRVMEKMDVRSLAELVRTVLAVKRPR
jgi:two-component system response regulator FixJ